MPPQQATQQPDFIPATAAPDFIPVEQSDTTPLEKQGVVRRFATRLMGVPDRLFDHPGDYLNPFSHGYWDTAKKEQSGELPSMVPTRPTIEMPGKQTIQDVKAHNYAGAVGDVLPEAYAFGSMAIPAAGRMMQRPSVARMVPRVGRYAGGAVGAEVGKAIDHPYAGAVVGAGAGEVAGRALVKMAPRMARSVGVSTGEPIPPEETTPLPPSKKFTPAEQPPVSERGVYMRDPRTGEQILQAAKDNLGGGQGKVAMQEAAPSPYRMKGSEIKDAVTVTPRKVLGPDRMLPAPKTEEPPPVEMQPLKAKTTTGRQAEVLKKSGIAAPKATMQAPDQIPSGDLLPDPKATFKGANSGEAALRQQLTDLKGPSQINKLRAIAVQRGIKVGPKDTNEVLIGKIADSATPEEIDAFEQARIERMQPDYSPVRMGERPTLMKSPEAMQPMSSGADLIEALQQMKKAAAAKK